MGLTDDQRKLAGIIPSERGAFTCTGAARLPQAPGDSAVNPRGDLSWMKGLTAHLRPLFDSRTPEELDEAVIHEEGDRLTSPPRPGSMVSVDGSGEWKVAKSTAKNVTIFMVDSHQLGSKFAGKSYQFRWDGEGFKRQRGYLTKPVKDESIGEAKRETFKAAKARLLAYLQSQGWAVKSHLKIPRADEFVHGYHTSLWFKPQAIYIGMSSHTNPSFGDARSMHIEIRGLDGAKFLKEVEKEARGDSPTYGRAWGESVEDDINDALDGVAGESRRGAERILQKHGFHKQGSSWKKGSKSAQIQGPDGDGEFSVSFSEGRNHRNQPPYAEKSPPGWEGTVKAMKKHKGIDNPYALAWHMKNKGMKSHKREGIGHVLQSLRGIGMLREGYTDDTAEEFAAALKRGLKAPWVQAYVSKLGGPGRHSVMLKLSLDPEAEWNNKILHNSRYAMFQFNGGKIEQHARHYKIAKFRKSKFKDVQDAINKINKWIAKADAA